MPAAAKRQRGPGDRHDQWQGRPTRALRQAGRPASQRRSQRYCHHGEV